MTKTDGRRASAAVKAILLSNLDGLREVIRGRPVSARPGIYSDQRSALRDGGIRAPDQRCRQARGPVTSLR